MEGIDSDLEVAKFVRFVAHGTVLIRILCLKYVAEGERPILERNNGGCYSRERCKFRVYCGMDSPLSRRPSALGGVRQAKLKMHPVADSNSVLTQQFILRTRFKVDKGTL